MNDGRRARRPEDKDQRRRQLTDTARVVFDEGTPFAALTMAAVATRAGLAKGTSYLYFPTKEALFLEVLREDLDGWFAALGAAISALPACDASPEALAEALTETLLACPRLLRLLAMLHAVLEANLDRESALQFKTFLASRLSQTDTMLHPRFPGFQEGDVARLLLRTHALVVGLEGMASPSAVVVDVLETPDLRWLKVDLRTELVATVSALLRGWQRR